jgi:hypothetical protein
MYICPHTKIPRFTPDGIECYKEMIAVGCDIQEVADYFVCTKETIELATLPGGELYDAHRFATGTFKFMVRAAQADLSKKFPTMARHLGHHILGQPVDPTPKDPGLDSKVVGTTPDWEAEPDDWLAQHAQSASNSATDSTIDRLKQIAASQDVPETPDAPTEE